MKKLLFILLACVSFSNIYAQSNKDSYDTYYRGIENSNQIELKKEQVSKIKKIKREYGQKFAAIGKNRSLSGYEKGKQKRPYLKS